MRARAAIALLLLGFAIVLLKPEPRRTLVWQVSRIPLLPGLSRRDKQQPHPSLAGVRLYTPGAWAALGPRSDEIAAQIRRQAEIHPAAADLWLTAGLLAGWSGLQRPNLGLFRRAAQAAPEDVAAQIWLARAIMFRYHLDALTSWPTLAHPGPRPDAARLDPALPHIMRARALDPRNGYPDCLLGYVRFAQGRDEEAIELVREAADKSRWRTYDAQTRRIRFLTLRRIGLPEPLALVYTRSDGWNAMYLCRLGCDVIEAARGFEEAAEHERAIACYALALSVGEQVREKAETPSSQETGRLVTRQVAGWWRADKQAIPSDIRPPGPYARRYSPGEYVREVRTREAQCAFIHYLRSHGAEGLAVRALFQWSISDSGDRRAAAFEYAHPAEQRARLRPLGVIYLVWSAQIVLLACGLVALGLAAVGRGVASVLPQGIRETLRALARADSEAARLARIVVSAGPLLIGIAHVLIVESAREAPRVFGLWHPSGFVFLIGVPFAILVVYTLAEVAWRRKRRPSEAGSAAALWAVRVGTVLAPLTAVFLACYLLLFLACPGPLHAVHSLAHEQVRVFYLPGVPLPR